MRKSYRSMQSIHGGGKMDFFTKFGSVPMSIRHSTGTIACGLPLWVHKRCTWMLETPLLPRLKSTIDMLLRIALSIECLFYMWCICFVLFIPAHRPLLYPHSTVQTLSFSVHGRTYFLWTASGTAPSSFPFCRSRSGLDWSSLYDHSRRLLYLVTIYRDNICDGTSCVLDLSGGKCGRCWRHKIFRYYPIDWCRSLADHVVWIGLAT